MPMMPLNALSEHPANGKIYFTSEIDDLELENSVRESGILHPIIVNDKCVIISGHRRYRAAVKLSLDEVPVSFKSFDNQDDELQYLILSNQYRSKTIEEKVREGTRLKEISARRGERTRDVIGKEIGMSGRTFSKAEKVVEAIDAMQESDPDQADRLRQRLNKSVDGAYKEAQSIEPPIEAAVNEEVADIMEKRKYFYLEDVYRLTSFMDAIYMRLAKARGSTTPESVGHMIGNISEMKERLLSWTPKRMLTCQACGGTGQIRTPDQKGAETVVKCGVCVDGKCGLYKPSDK